MKAMVIEQFGGADVFVQKDIREPELDPGQVLIRVAGSSVNPIDFKVRSGAAAPVAPELPAVLHGDVSGTVERVAPDVTGFAPGDEVYACAGGVKGLPGALAELMPAEACLVARKPTSLPLLDAAAVPLVAITAWESLIDRARIRPGDNVLVHAGAGGVGHMGVQLAKVCGAVVSTTVSTPEKADIARRLGADITINYREQSVDEYVAQHTGGRGYDVVFDTVGGENLARSFQAVRPGGTVVMIAGRGSHDLTPLHGKGVTLHAVLMLLPMLTGHGKARHGDILRRVAHLIDDGRLSPLLDPEVFAFTEVARAHRKLEQDLALGKIRLKAAFA